MASAKEMIAAGLLYGGVWAVAGGTVGGLLDLANNFDIKHRITHVKEDIQQDQDTIMTADKNLQEIRIKLGETCMASLGPYTKGHRFEDVSEDAVVIDLVNGTSKPCGDNLTGVRQKVRDVRESTALLLGTEASLTENQALLEKKSAEQREDGEFNGLLIGSVALGVPSLLWGISAPKRRLSWWRGENLGEWL